MARYLGVDYGEKRIGLAYGDELGLATPLPAVTVGGAERRIAAVLEVARARRVEALVVGLPLNMDGTAGPKVREAEAFVAALTAAQALPVHWVDERLTSYAAEELVPRGKRGLRSQKQRRAGGEVDSQAAALILQDFLDEQAGKVADAGEEAP